MSELDELRTEISELDRRLLELLNRRLELVAAVRDYKDAAGERWIDPEREAELLQALVAANGGPLSERGVRSIFSAVLDVLKQEVAADRGASSPPPDAAERQRAVERLAVIGTGLVGTSVALAAGRTGTRCRGFDADPAVLERSAGRGAIEPASSLAEAVADAELVLVAVPVGVAPAVVQEALESTGPAVVVTDVASTKRPLASVADPRFVPGHPVAGGATGGPARAAADLFDAATWFLAPTGASSAESIGLVERFVASLGARAVRTDAEAHDRLLALTSHLPHALANLLMLRVAEASATDDAPLAFAGASLREMTRLAGANAAVWSDIFLGNADEIAAALSGLRGSLDELEQALRTGDRERIGATIAAAATARERLESFAYRTAPAQLNRIRIRVPDRPGVLARITQILGGAQINLEDFELRHVSPEYGGVLVILVAGADNAARARELLRREGYAAA
ncbi:MAG TPA: prephenate dehydrogenase/arogenate dehydrogenase family protein, partial [Gaiellaceae bacterium]|nr:prephenate dehydrogenase/arogenate dehydrogenase family protein [Gaiellaceae bacterium]